MSFRRMSLRRTLDELRARLLLGAVVGGVSLALIGCGKAEIQPPRALDGEGGMPVVYPESLSAEGVKGTALVRVLVNETGAVDSVALAESSGHAVLDSAALAGARELRFEPGRKDGKRTALWATIPVVFDPQGTARP
jgi:TonB family protein